METTNLPSPSQLNALLEDCGESTHSEERWLLALERSVWHLSILESATGELVGFVRATSDLALNANLWNLCARPGDYQAQILAVWCTAHCICCAAIFRVAACRFPHQLTRCRHSKNKDL